MLKRGQFLFLALMLLLIFPIPGLPATETGNLQGNIDDVAKAILTYFPKVSGKVTAVEGEVITVDFGKEKGVTPGALLSVYREKEPFSHPITGIPLGRFEEAVGTIEVDQVEQARLTARNTAQAGIVRVGDQVRITATRIPIGVTLVSQEGPGFLATELVSALAETGRFRVDLLPSQADPSEALKKNDLYLIRLATSKEEGRFMMQLKIENTQTGRSLSDMAVQIVQSEESDLILEHLQYQLFQQQQQQQQQKNP
ncbi:MAG: hypothetical protein HY282_18920 [Nitrospirae bacterium]|nr:hypothetical protein [Candidatus Manganitrophaceae bacterium]